MNEDDKGYKSRIGQKQSSHLSNCRPPGWVRPQHDLDELGDVGAEGRRDGLVVAAGDATNQPLQIST